MAPLPRGPTTYMDKRCYYFDIYKCWQKLKADSKICPTKEEFDDFLAPFLKQYNQKLQQQQQQDSSSEEDELDDDIIMAVECILRFVVVAASSSDNNESISMGEIRRIFVVTTDALQQLLKLHQRIVSSYYDNNNNKAVNKSNFKDDDSSATNNIIKLLCWIFEIYACLTSSGASEAFKHDNFLPSLTQIHHTMILFPSNTTIQLEGCKLLQNLSNPLLQELVAAGSTALIVNSIENHIDDPKIQYHGNATLYNLLPVTTNETLQHSYQLFFGNNNDNQEVSTNSSDDVVDGGVGTAEKKNLEDDTNDDSDDEFFDSAEQEEGVPELTSSSSSSEQEQEQRQEQTKTSFDHPKSFATLCLVVLKGMTMNNNDNSGGGVAETMQDQHQYGLMVLQRLCQQDDKCFDAILGVVEDDTNNAAVSDRGLLLIQKKLILLLDTMKVGDDNSKDNENDDESTNMTLAQVLCQFFRDMTFYYRKQSKYLQSIAMMDNNYKNKSTLHLILELMQKFDTSSNIIDPGMASLRNLSLEQGNALQLQQYYDPLVGIMDKHTKDAAIQAYGYDILGRVVLGEERSRGNMEEEKKRDDAVTLFNSNLYRRVISVMRQHSNHGGVQDRAIFWLLCVLSSEQQHYKSLMKASIQDTTILLDLLKSANKLVSSQPQKRSRLQKLICIVEDVIHPGTFTSINVNITTNSSVGMEKEKGVDVGIMNTNHHPQRQDQRQKGPRQISDAGESKVEDEGTDKSTAADDAEEERLSRAKIEALLAKADKVERRVSGKDKPWHMFTNSSRGGGSPGRVSALASSMGKLSFQVSP